MHLLNYCILKHFIMKLCTNIRTLRQKLGDAAGVIETVRGVGYKIGGTI